MLNRREFVTASGATLLTALAHRTSAALAAVSSEWRNKQSSMAYRRLGRTGFMISEFVMGGNTIAPNNHEHVRLALDMGLNYLDTAPAYGRGASEEGYSHVIKGRKRDSFFLNTKVSLWDLNRNLKYSEIFQSLPEPEKAKLKRAAQEQIERRRAADFDYLGNYFGSQKSELEAAALSNVMSEKFGDKFDRSLDSRQLIIDSLEQSLRRLGTDHVDLLMCPHGASTPHEIEHHHEIFEAFETLKKQGKVRYLGVSAHSDPAGVLEAAMDAKVYSMAMVAYNIVNRSFLESALDRAKKEDFGVIAMKVARPVHHGRNNSQPNDPQRVRLIEEAVPGPLKVPQKAYVWALRNSNISGVISEMVNQTMVKENLPLAGGES